MVNRYGLGPTKMPLIKNPENAIYCNSGRGPTFGAGHDLNILGNANTNTSGHSILGNSYGCPPGQQRFFTGAQDFTVTNYEVFGLLN